MSELRDRFDNEMRLLHERARDEVQYHATYFIQMVQERDGLDTAKALLGSKKMHDGFTRLWEAHRLDLAVEALVLREPWRQLFLPEELLEAERRLRRLGYSFGHGEVRTEV